MAVDHDLRGLYARVVDHAMTAAPRIAPIPTGLTASIDDIYRVGDTGLHALVHAAQGGPGDRLAQRILERISAGRGGELVDLWEQGPDWIAAVLGIPDVRQIGGNAAQVSWTLATVGAPTVLALRDRSAVQLGVLDGRIQVATADGLEAVDAATAVGAPTKHPHAILEFTEGALLQGTPLPRSTRVMVRFSHEPLETDQAFFEYAAHAPVTAALVSGLATQPSMDTPDVHWAARLTAMLGERGVRVHHELSEFRDGQAQRAALGALPASSLGMSLSELALATGSARDPGVRATDVAEAFGAQRVVVHADEWALMVTRDPSTVARDTLALANALAGARARLGRPSASPAVPDDAVFASDLPAEGAIRDGWHAVVVPSPYEARPLGTVGLGDTFTAGLLLGDAIDRMTTSPRS